MTVFLCVEIFANMVWKSMVAIAVLLASSINLVYVLRFTRQSMLNQNIHYSYHGHDHPAMLSLPDSEFVHMTVEDSVHYPLLGHASDDQWDSLSSESSGYVRLGPDDRLFAVTMFHELHCLRMLNFAFGKASIATPEHIRHCLSYLKHGILCSPDLTIEPGDFEERDFNVERVGATHTCRDWSAVYTVMDDNYRQWKLNATW